MSAIQKAVITSKKRIMEALMEAHPQNVRRLGWV